MKENTERIGMCSMISLFFSKLYNIETFREKSKYFLISKQGANSNPTSRIMF